MITYDTAAQLATAKTEKNLCFEVTYKYKVDRITQKISARLVDLTINSNGYLTKDLRKALKNTKELVLNTLSLIYFSKDDSRHKKTRVSSPNGRIENRMVYTGTKSTPSIKRKSN